MTVFNSKSEFPQPQFSDLSLVEVQQDDLQNRPSQLQILSKVELGQPHRLPDGTEQRYLYTFSDGRNNSEPSYEARLYNPYTQKHNRGLISTVPLLTGLEGMHESLNDQAIAEGLVAVAVGHEISRNAIKSLRHIGHASLSQEAHVQLLIHQDLAHQGHFSSKEVVGTGYSLAAIVLNGVAAYAHEHNTKLVHGEGLDPGPVDKLRIEFFHGPALAASAIQELTEITDMLIHSSPKEAQRLLRTFPISLDQTLQNYDFFFALTQTGESRRIAQDVPTDTSLNITSFKGFRYNQIDKYKKIFANHPHIRIEEEDGCHFSGARPKWRMLIVGRTALVQRELDNGLTPHEIDHKEIDTRVRTKIKADNSLHGL